MENNMNTRGPGGAGRISNMHENEKEQAHHSDISHVDRQEGEMENGELGGNFNVANPVADDKQERREEKDYEAPPH